jgi:hypothetical protein
LALTPEQRTAAQDLLRQHKAEAREIGVLFRLRKVQPAGLASAVGRTRAMPTDPLTMNGESR